MGGVIEAGDDFGGIDVDGVAQANKHVYRWRVFAGFEHAYVLAGDTGMGRNFLLGKPCFQSEFPKFFRKHASDANREAKTCL